MLDDVGLVEQRKHAHQQKQKPGRAGGESGYNGHFEPSTRISETANEKPDAYTVNSRGQVNSIRRPEKIFHLPEQNNKPRAIRITAADGLLAPPVERGTGERAVWPDRHSRSRAVCTAAA